jgi:hypothetical protein
MLSQGMLRLLTEIAARLVMLQVLLLAVVFLLMLVAGEDGPGRRAFGVDWPLSGFLILVLLVSFAYAGFALLKPRLFGEGVPALAALVNVASVTVVALSSAWSFVSYLLRQPSTMPGLYVLFLVVAALTTAGALLAIWASWRGRSSVSAAQ